MAKTKETTELVQVAQSNVVAEEEESALLKLKPLHQRFVHLYVTGEYKVNDLAELLQVTPQSIRLWLKRPEIKAVIDEIQTDEDETVRQQLKATRMAALQKMRKLLNSPVDGIAYQAARDILDRTGHKAPTKQETKTEIHVTFEDQLREVIEQTKTPEDFIDVDDYEVM